jgi:glycosyltransferase involved in cell wall biosynthesis
MPEIRDSSQPDLSLAIPCFNEEELLANTVGRLWDVFESRGVRLEMVLVDNGSTDGTGAVIDRLIEQGLPVTKKTIAVNAGYGNGILVGLAACRGRWVGILHADGQVEPEDVLRVYEVANGSRRPCLVM